MTRFGFWMGLALTLSACSTPPYQFAGSTTCFPGTGMVQTWCNADGDCEFRVVGGLTTACLSGEAGPCAEAARLANESCIALSTDGGMPDGGGIVEADAGARDAGALTCTPTTELDLLFMIDNSQSMEQEQASLRIEIPRILSILAPTHSLHLGVITSDMGAGNVPPGEFVPSCLPGFGDDGVLRNTSRGLGTCEVMYPMRIFSFEGTGDVTALAADLGCVADIGTGGCGFEQQLEAALKALSPASPQAFVSSSYVPPVFVDGASGHGDDPATNLGFLRPDSVLAIVVVTDEEDCSVPDYNMFYMNDPEYVGNPLNLRCSRFPADLYPTQRYIDGFLQLRSSPGRLVYAPIVGVPEDLVGDSYETILGDSRMIEIEDNSASPPVRLLPSCSTSDGIAFPPRRMVEVARGLRDRGAATSLQSICVPSFQSGLDAITTTITGAMTCTR